MLSLSLSQSRFFFVCVCFSSFLFFLDFFSFIIAFFFLSLLLKFCEKCRRRRLPRTSTYVKEKGLYI